jgi:membrane-associated phospholipid phosphatase
MIDEEPAFDNDHRLTRNELYLIIGVIVAILMVGAVLYWAGYNESFYSEEAWVRDIFEALTELGNDKLYLTVFCLVFLTYDMRFGKRLAWVFFLTLFTGDFLKQFFQDPRPPANELRDSPVSGYGFPSGHATTSVAFYGYFMLSHRNAGWLSRPLTAICLFAIVTVPISRMVIGAHDLQDVVGAYVITLTILIVYMLLRPRVSEFMAPLSLRSRIGIQVVAVLLLWYIGTIILILRHPGEVTAAMEELGQASGLLLGCAVAFPLEDAYVKYRPDRLTWRNRVLAAVIGTILAIGLYVGMSGLGEMLLPSYAADMVSHFVLILMLALLAPYVLKRLLPEAEGHRPPPSEETP